MKKVIIRYCKIWIHNRLFAVRVAAFIKNESGIEVEIDSGGKIGEFSVWVDGKLVERKAKHKFTDKKKVLNAVQQEVVKGVDTSGIENLK